MMFLYIEFGLDFHLWSISLCFSCKNHKSLRTSQVADLTLLHSLFSGTVRGPKTPASRGLGEPKEMGFVGPKPVGELRSTAIEQLEQSTTR